MTNLQHARLPTRIPSRFYKMNMEEVPQLMFNLKKHLSGVDHIIAIGAIVAHYNGCPDIKIIHEIKQMCEENPSEMVKLLGPDLFNQVAKF